MKINIISHVITCPSEESIFWWLSIKVTVKLTHVQLFYLMFCKGPLQLGLERQEGKLSPLVRNM